LTEIVSEEIVRAATALVLLAPHPPLIFMGQEWASRQRFHFFCDFGPELGAKVAEGRRREFARFYRHDGREQELRFPDPNDADAFQAGKLDWESLDLPTHQDWFSFHRELLRIRRQEIVPFLGKVPVGSCYYKHLAARAIVVQWKLGDDRHDRQLTLLANVGPKAVDAVKRPAGRMLFSTKEIASIDGETVELPGWTVAWYLENV
jgi:maltooligosyltrehalose trehalohydrolase